MYSTERIKTSYTTGMEETYLTDHVLRGEENMMPPIRDQKKSFVKSFLDTSTNIVANIYRLYNSLSSRMNNPLSVTLVDDGSIASELFRNSLEKTKPLTSDKTYNSNIKEEKHLDIMKIYGMVLETEKSQDELDRLAEKHMKIYSYDHDSPVEIHPDNKDTGMITKVNLARGNTHPDATREDNNAAESFSLPYSDKTETLHTIGNSCTMEIDPQKSMGMDEDVLYNEKDSVSNSVDIDGEDASIDIKSFHIVCNSDVPPKAADPIEKSMASALLSDVYCKWNKMWHGATNQIYRKTDIFDSSSEIPMKRPYLLRQRRRANTAATGRGRGRAKCQLRRSGVSQTRHRKKHTKHCLAVDIEDNHRTGQDVEMYRTVQNYSDSSSDDINDYDVPDDSDFIGQITSSPVKFTITDTLLNKDKPKMCDNKIKEPAANLHKDYTDKMCYFRENSSRPRLISECSNDSEDSFCIVFDVESDGNSRINQEDDNSRTSCEIESEENEFTTQKVFLIS